jgi:DMSO/TMAO reductase YedYZ molybdopterin-dependent catalytic subunit
MSTETDSGRASASEQRNELGGAARIPWLTASVLSVLAFGASIGIGQLVAGVVSPVSAPYRAVADAAVRLAPSWLVDFGKTLVLPGLGVGKADKFGLLLGVGVALLVVAALTGVASRSGVRPGRRVIVVVGLVGLAAVVTSPVFTLPDLLAPLASVGAGLWTFRWLHEKALGLARSRANGPNRWLGPLERPTESPTRPDRVPDRWGSVSRRNLLVSGAAVGVGAAGAEVLGDLLGAGVDINQSRTDLAPLLHPSEPAPPIPAGADFVADGTPTFLTSTADFYRIDTALSLPVKAAQDWSMRVHGMVERELTIRYRDLLRRPLVERPLTLTCVSNEVNGALISNARFLGVDLRELLLEAGVQPGAEQLFSTSQDGWTAGTPLDVVLEPGRGAMLALGMNGEPLPLEHGYPVRMVVPGLYGYVSATKWLADLELTTFDAKQPYWRQRGWARLGPIKTESRIDKPGGFERVPAGRVTVAGIAWAQHRGISKVEVRIDGGPWQPAQLATDVSADTWRMWRAFVTVGSGDHSVESRATDGTGVPQTDLPADPIPDGASGYPMISFTAA